MFFVKAAKIIAASLLLMSLVLVEYDTDQLLILTSLSLFNTIFLYSKPSPIMASRLSDCMFGIGIALASFGLVGLNVPVLLFEVIIPCDVNNSALLHLPRCSMIPKQPVSYFRFIYNADLCDFLTITDFIYVAHEIHLTSPDWFYV